MSHYAVLVLTDGKKTVEELLAPYDESLQVAPYVYRTKEEIIKIAKERKQNYIKIKNEGKEISDWMKNYFDAETDEEFYNCEYDENCIYDEKGNELSTYNPNSKWDWYSFGGRFKRKFSLKEDEYEYGCKIKDIDMSIDKKKYDNSIRYWEVVVDGSPLKDGESESDFFNFYKKEWYLETYKNKETYAKIMSSFSTYSVVTPNGVWHTKGKMGWWGMSSETPEESLDWDLHFKERFIDTANTEWTAYLIDCHI